MNGLSPNQIHKHAALYSSNKEFINKVVADARILHSRGLPIIFTLRHLALLTDLPFRYLHSVVGRKFCPYTIYAKQKSNGGKRIISNPHYPLRKVQEFINSNILYTNFVDKKIFDCVYSFRKKRSIVDNARKHIGAKWLIKVDIKDFFSSITENKIYQFFISLGYSNLLSFELTRLVTWTNEVPPITIESDSTLLSSNISIQKFDTQSLNIEDYKYKYYYQPSIGSLPQGASTSPQLSNIIFSPLDQYFLEIALNYGYTYTRYADDLIFSTFEDIGIKSARQLIKIIDNKLKHHGYILNHYKTKISPPGCKKVITGILVDDYGIHISKHIKNIIKKNIFYAEKNGLKAQREHSNFHGNTFTFLKYLLGMINYAHQIDPNFASTWSVRLKKLARNSGYFNIWYYPKI